MVTSQIDSLRLLPAAGSAHNTAYLAVATLNDALRPGRGLDTDMLMELLARDTPVARGSTANPDAPLSRVHRPLNAALRRHRMQAEPLHTDQVGRALEAGYPVLLLGANCLHWSVAVRNEAGQALWARPREGDVRWVRIPLLLDQTKRAYKVSPLPLWEV